MRIGLLDLARWDYRPSSVASIPMGGTQSGACYLAQALVGLGHQVWFINHTKSPGIVDGIECLGWDSVGKSRLRSLGLDVVIVIQRAGMGHRLRDTLGPKVRLVLWTGDSAGQAVVARLGEPAERDVYDGFAMVSQWQANQFHERFAIDPARVAILRNAISPPFVSLFGPGQSVLSEKTLPPILAYTSAPYRGLEILLNVFPAIQAEIPGVRLEVLSSMIIHGQTPEQDKRRYGALYERCRQMEGVEYIGALPQPELARRMRRVTMLTYPNIYKETSCIAAMEALAAGCHVVSSDLAALPETTAGFARLVPVGEGQDAYQKKFIRAVIEVLNQARAEPSATETRLACQIEYFAQQCTWPIRARQWVQWLAHLQRR